MKTRIYVASVMLVWLSTPAVAQTVGGPPIAYVKPANNGHEIYLVNATGGGAVRVHKGEPKLAIQWIDLKPGGNEVAFSENWRIKVLKFYDHGLPNGAPMSVTTSCTSWHPDYHPSGDGSLVFITACAGRFSMQKYTPGAAAPATLFDLISSNRVRWNRAGTHLYYDEETFFNSGIMHLKRRDMATGQVADLGTLTSLDSFDVTRVGDQLVHGSPTAPKLFDFETMTGTSQSTPVCVAGQGFHYSPDGTQFIYQTPHSARGDTIMIGASNCNPGASPLTGKGTWGKSDWRSN